MENTNQVSEQSAQPNLLQKLCSMQIGALSLPMYIVLAVVVLGSAAAGQFKPDMISGFAIMMILGIFLGHIGQKIPVLKDIGGPAIFSIFVPAMVVYYTADIASVKSLVGNSVAAITALTKNANFLYFYIASLVAGSILGMVRSTLISGFLKMFVPLVVGTVLSCVVGVLVGTLTGLGTFNSFFYVVVPIISGGVGEGILPLSVGYSAIMGPEASKDLIGQLIPAAMLGNVVAIMLAGYLHKLGQKKPHLTGNGQLMKSGDQKFEEKKDVPFDVSLMGVGMLLACCCFLLGGLLSIFIPIPAAIIMILAAALIKVAAVLPARMELASYQWYRFVSANLTWPLLVAIGVLYTDWGKVLEAISFAYVLTVVSTVVTMVASGFFCAKFLNMNPIEAAIVTGTHSGLGGTGDVAILSASRRMELMPFAQIATRLGGAGVVVMAVILFKIYYAV